MGLFAFVYLPILRYGVWANKQIPTTHYSFSGAQSQGQQYFYWRFFGNALLGRAAL